MDHPHKKLPLFGEIEDVISIGALLRPTIEKAVGELPRSEIETFRKHVIEAERELANSRLEFRERFQRAQEKLVSTYAYAPVWRFISGRIEECWSEVETLTTRELSIVSLLFGIMLEEAESGLARKTNRKSKKSA